MDIQALFEKDKNGLTLLEALILKTITAHLDTIMNLNQDTLGDVLYNYIMDKKEEAERQERLSQ